MKTRDNQHGGIVIFAVIGILLVSLLAGALYVGKQQADLAHNAAPAPIAIDTEKDEAATGKDTTPAAPAKDESKPAPATPAPATTPTPTPKPQTSAAPAPTPSPTPAAPRVATVPNSGPSEPLPPTGPSDVLLGISALGAVTFVAFAFVQSNFRLRRSALNR